MNINIDNILEKYWKGETSLEEEHQLRNYFKSDSIEDRHQQYKALFGFFSQEQQLKIKDDEISIGRSMVRTTKVRSLMIRMTAIAASVVILLGIGMQIFDQNDTMYKNKYTELQDPDEALAITMDALGFLSNKYESGSQPMTKYMKNFEKTEIVKMN